MSLETGAVTMTAEFVEALEGVRLCRADLILNNIPPTTELLVGCAPPVFVDVCDVDDCDVEEVVERFGLEPKTGSFEKDEAVEDDGEEGMLFKAEAGVE